MERVGIATKRASVSLTLPTGTPAYASGQGLWQSATAGSCTPLQLVTGTPGLSPFIEIASLRLYKSGTGVSGATFRVHFFTNTFAIGAGDNASLSLTPTLLTDAIGTFDVTVDQAYVNGAVGVGVPTSGVSRLSGQTSDANGTLWCAIEARGAYTRAASEVFTVEAFVYRGA